MHENEQNDTWYTKHRPNSLEELYLPDDQRAFVGRIVETGRTPGLLLTGRQGVGKTTVARIIVDQVALAALSLNSSSMRGIDTVRDTIEPFAEADHEGPGHRIVYLEEADGLTPEAQGALLSLIERTMAYTRFILTANNVEKLSGNLRSRLNWVEMEPVPEPKRAEILARVLDAEGVDYTWAAVERVAAISPDMRAVLHEARMLAMAHGWCLPAETQLPGTVLETVGAVAELSDGARGVSQGQLRDHLDLGRAAVSNRVSEAAAEGLIENRNPGPGTADALVLTDRGREVSGERAGANDPGESP